MAEVENRLPTFLVIGAAKAGTTALYHLLDQHPQVYMSPVKETNFFCFEGETLDYKGPGVTVNESITGFDDYRGLFSSAKHETALGEVSPMYMVLPIAAERIHKRLPNVRLIAVLRHPVDRAYSSFLHLRRDGREPFADFEEALREEPQRIADSWGFLWRYRELSRYADSLAAYYRVFSAKQILVLSYEDFRDSPQVVLQKIFEHVGVDSSYHLRMTKTFNVSGEPRSALLARVLRTPGAIRSALGRLMPQPLRTALGSTVRRLNLKRPHLDPELRRRLTIEFSDDIAEVERLCNIDLSHWLYRRDSP